MSKTLAPSRVTTRDPKGLKFVSIVEAPYNKAGLSEDEAQRVNEAPGLVDLIARFIEDNRRTNQFANEEVRSNWEYPPEYQGPKPIEEQIIMIAKFFGLDATQALEYAKHLPELPEGAEGWFAVPSPFAVAQKLLPAVEGFAAQNSELTNMAHGKIGETRKYQNYRAGQITPQRLRMQPRTFEAIRQIAEQQPGDILIIAAQFGRRHRGRSVRRAREVFRSNEFGFGWFFGLCMTLTHPERFVRWEQLHADFPGDDFDPAAGGTFGDAPYVGFNDGQLKSGAHWTDRAHDSYGSVSGFLPARLASQGEAGGPQ